MVTTGADFFGSIIQHLNQQNPDLMILATHQIVGLNRWLSTPAAEPLAREARCPTFFVPPFAEERVVSYQDGTVTIERASIPVMQLISPQFGIDHAVDLASLLAVDTIDWKIFMLVKRNTSRPCTFPNIQGGNGKSLPALIILLINYSKWPLNVLPTS